MPDKFTFRLDWAAHTLLQLISRHQFGNVLDIGSGEGEHKRFLEFFGKKVFSVDKVKTADYIGDFLEIEFDRPFEVVWCSHVLEQQRNVGVFLDKVFDNLVDNGILAITVPRHTPDRLISGHLTSWSIPLLCYNLVMAGFDCREAQIISIFELGLIVRKKRANHSELRCSSAHGADAGAEFAEVAGFFPFVAQQGATLSGHGAINWRDPKEYRLPVPPGIEHPEVRISSKNFDRYPEYAARLSFQGD